MKNESPKYRFDKFDENWLLVKISNAACQFKTGGTPSTKEPIFWDGTIPWIQSSDLQKDKLFGVKPQKFISEEGLQNSSAKLIPKNSIAVVTRVGVGKLAIIDQDYTTSQDFLSILDLKGDTHFLVYSIYRMLQKESTQLQGTSIKGITKEDLLSKKISLPRIEEQSAIGSLFRTLDDLLSSYKDNLANYQALKATMLSKMFPKSGQTIPEIRLDGFKEEWEVKKLRKVVQINPKSELPEKFKYIDLESVVGTRINKIREEYKETAPTRAQRLAEKGDIFYQTVRPYQKNNYLFKLDDVDYVFSTGYAQLRPKRTSCDSDFLLTLLQDNKFLSKVLDRCTGTSYPAINAKDLVEISIVIPKVEEQQAIGSYFSNLDNLINSHQEKISQLETLKKKLLQDMFI
ncbi:restriction endonuclease subunit S [Streptococcus cristatus]|uniref:restriction endonuclease subunit S n=1 Tax=Streptococcus cristatus TaxID=45634 RepID=UPI001CBAD8EF|nr:restriction endonuclease subunit S [Streptococcus cristatus]MBZ2152889.1 restriction endonuclease subunit S [Streptococcus cristatus]